MLIYRGERKQKIFKMHLNVLLKDPLLVRMLQEYAYSGIFKFQDRCTEAVCAYCQYTVFMLITIFSNHQFQQVSSLCLENNIA